MVSCPTMWPAWSLSPFIVERLRNEERARHEEEMVARRRAAEAEQVQNESVPELEDTSSEDDDMTAEAETVESARTTKHGKGFLRKLFGPTKLSNKPGNEQSER